jgi:hypothetical protein
MVDDVYLLVDFGSTYTKIVAVDLTREEILGRAQAPTTVQSNVLDGLKGALAELTIRGRPIDDATIRESNKLASSSAAGGLCIVSVGLVPDLTLEAARKAALGADAKVVGAYAYELDADRLHQIEKSCCDLVLVIGGTDGGGIRIQHGKDLTQLKMLVGTGGIFSYNPYPAKVLEAVLFNPNNPLSLKPKSPEVYI